MKVTLRLDDSYQQAVEQRIEELQAESVRELEQSGESELAEQVGESEPDPSVYVKRLVREDLAESDLLPQGESR